MFGDGTSLDRPKLVNAYDPGARVQIFQTWVWTEALDDMIDKVLTRVTPDGQRGRVIIVFDELGGLASSNVVPWGLIRIYTQGRGKGVGAWAMFQGVKGYPTVIKKQTEIWFIFRITDENDRGDLYAYVHDPQVIDRKIPRRYFWLYDDEWDTAMYFKPIKVTERLKPQ